MRDLSGEDAVLLVEWPERGAGALPPANLIIRIRYQTNGRHLTLDAMTPEARTLISSIDLPQATQVAKAQVQKQRG